MGGLAADRPSYAHGASQDVAMRLRLPIETKAGLLLQGRTRARGSKVKQARYEGEITMPVSDRAGSKEGLSPWTKANRLSNRSHQLRAKSEVKQTRCEGEVSRPVSVKVTGKEGSKFWNGP